MMKQWLGILCSVCVATSALAVNVQGFRPNIGPNGGFTLLGSTPTPQRAFRLGLSANFAGDPLKLRDTTGTVLQSVVKSMATADLGIEYGLMNRWSLGVSTPLTFTRHIPVGGGLTLGNSFSPGDLLGYTKVLLTPLDSSIGVSIIPFIETPLGSLEKFTGNQKMNYGAKIALDKQWDRFALTFNTGYRGWATNDEVVSVIGSTGTIPLDDEITAGIGGSFAAIPEKLDVVAEVRGSTTLQDFAGGKSSSPVEIDAGVKAHFLDKRLTVNGGAGAGLIRGYSAPLYRVFAGLTYEIPLAKPAPKKEAFVRKEIILRGVNFDTASHALTASARNILEKNVSELQTEPGLRIRVEGHTDHRGSDDYNVALSLRRCESVRSYFVANSIEASRIDIYPFGESQPLVPNTTPTNMAQNRRVVVQILEYR